MDVLALPDSRNFNPGNNFETDFLRRFLGELVAVKVVMVGDGNAPQPLALAEREQFIDSERPVRKLGVQVQVCITAVLAPLQNSGPSSLQEI